MREHLRSAQTDAQVGMFHVRRLIVMSIVSNQSSCCRIEFDQSVLKGQNSWICFKVPFDPVASWRGPTVPQVLLWSDSIPMERRRDSTQTPRLQIDVCLLSTGTKHLTCVDRHSCPSLIAAWGLFFEKKVHKYRYNVTPATRIYTNIRAAPCRTRTP